MLNNLVQIISALAPIVIGVVKNVEDAYEGVLDGEAKKEEALDIIGSIIETVDFFREKENKQKELILEVAGDMIDWVVKGLNLTDLWDDSILIELQEGDELQ